MATVHPDSDTDLESAVLQQLDEMPSPLSHHHGSLLGHQAVWQAALDGAQAVSGPDRAVRPSNAERTESRRKMPAATQGAPLPKRPKGRLFVGSVLLLIIATVSWSVWNSLLRYEAYGSVTGRAVQLASRVQGLVRQVHVQPGMVVNAGQLLVTLDTGDLEDEAARLREQLEIARARLQAESLRSHWLDEQRMVQKQSARSDYFELLAQLAQERAHCDELASSLRRAEQMRSSLADSVPQEQIESLRLALQGQQEKIEQLKAAVAARSPELPEVDGFEATPDKSSVALPLIAEITALENELVRHQTRLNQSAIRSQVAGRVLTIYHVAGELVEANEAVVEILLEDTVQPVLYVRQSQAAQFRPEQPIELEMDPEGRRLSGTVERLGDRMEPVPEPLARWYAEGEPVLPVYVRVRAADQDQLRVNATVKLPWNWSP